MDFKEIMNIVKTFLDAIVTLFKSLGLDKLFKKDEKPADDTESTTGA